MLPPALSFDLSHWSQIEIRGQDRQAFLNGFCTNDVRQRGAGTACEAFIPDIKGRILGHVLVAIDPDRLLLISVPETGTALVKHLSKYVLDADVEIADVSGSRGLLCLWGRDLKEGFSALGFGELPDPGTSRELEIQDQRWVALGAELTNPPCVLLSGLRASLADWRESVPVELLELGTSELFQILRIEAGFPLWGADISAEHLAQEAGRTQRAISFQKGCYLGQEPIARLDAMGHTNKELRGLLIEGADVPAGSEILLQDAVVGRITSAAWNPLRMKTVALGMIRTAGCDPGSRLMVRTAQESFPAEVYWPALSIAE